MRVLQAERLENTDIQLPLDKWLSEYGATGMRLWRSALDGAKPWRETETKIDRQARAAADRTVLFCVGAMWSWEKLRRRVYERDGGVCWWCGGAVEWASLEAGHLIPRYLGGEDTTSNVVAMHSLCNRLLGPDWIPEEEAHFAASL